MMKSSVAHINIIGIAAALCLSSCAGRDAQPPGGRADAVAQTSPAADTARSAAPRHAPPPATPARHADSAASPAAINPIDAGKSVGKVRINEDFAQVVGTLGEPDSSDAGMGHVVASWGSKQAAGNAHRLDIYASFNNDASKHIVREIRVTSPRFTTASGISTGSRLADITAAYKAVRVVATYDDGAGRVMIYDDMKGGIAFEVMGDAAGRCVAIIVHEPGVKVGTEYLPMHNYQESGGSTGK